MEKVLRAVRERFESFKNNKPLLFRVLFILVSSVLFLGVLPYDKGALTIYKFEKLGTIFSYVLCGLTALLMVLLFIFKKKSRNQMLLLLGVTSIFALIGFGWIVGSLLNDTLHFSRFISFGCLFVYYCFVVLYFDKIDDFLLSLSFSLLFLIILSLILYLFHFDQVIYNAGYGNFYFKGIANNRNSYVELSLFPSVFFTYFVIKEKKIWKMIMFGIFSAVTTLSTILTLSATSMIILFVVFLLLLFWRWARILTKPYVILILFVGVFLITYFAEDIKTIQFLYEIFKKDSTATGRTLLWGETFKLFNENLVFGYGFDNTKLQDLGLHKNDPHNGILYILLTQGIFGLIIVLAIIFFVMYKNKRNSLEYSFILGFIWGWCIRCVVESGFSYTHFVFWGTALAFIKYRLEQEPNYLRVPAFIRNKEEVFAKDKGMKKASKNTLMLYLLTFAKIVFPLVTLPYLTRVLSTSTYGTVAYVKAVMSYVQIIIDFGFLYSAVKDIVKLGSEKEQVNKVVSNTTLAKILLSLLSLIVVLICCFTIPILKSNILFTLLSFIVPFLSIFIFDFLFRGIEKMQFTTLCFVVVRVISTALVFIFVKNDSQILLIPIFDIAGTLVAIGVSIFALKRNGYSFISPKLKESLILIKQSSPYFINVVASTVFGIFLTLIIGIAIPDAAQISYWAVSMQLVGAVQALYVPISNGIYPYMIKRKNIKLISTILMIFMPIVILGTLFCFFYAPLIIQIVSGEAYVSGAYVFKTLAPVLLLSFPVVILGWPVLGPINKTKEITITTIVGAAVQVVAVGILLIIHQFNLFTVAITRSVSESTMLAARIYYLFKFKGEFSKPKEDNENKVQDKPILSIIIPCYISANLLIKYLESLSLEDPKNFEFIIVNDSLENSEKAILEDFKSKTSLEIVLINNKKNVGPGESRNVGLGHASGKYVTFLDSDDTFEDKFFDIASTTLLGDYDCYLYDYNVVSGNKKKRASIIDSDTKDILTTDFMTSFVRGSPWGKIYKRSIIEEHSIKFLPLIRNEDTPFTKVALSYCKTIKYIKKPLYNYVQMQGSLMHDEKYIDPNRWELVIASIKENINPDLKGEVFEFLYLSNFFYGICKGKLRFLNKAEWKQYVESVKPQAVVFDNKYFDYLSISKQFIIQSIYQKRYSLLKLLLGKKHI